MVEAGFELPSQSFPIQRADLVRYAGASGDFNVIHWNERATLEVGAKVTEVLDDGRARIAITATCDGQGVLGKAQALVRLP